MEPLTTAILAALAKLSEPAIKDAYSALKTVIVRKFGEHHDVVKAVEDLEKRPDSVGRKETLREEIKLSEASQDQEILKAANALADRVKALPEGQQIINQIVTGNRNVFSAFGSITIKGDQE